MRALVTGGNRGIGRAIAAGLVAKGFDVTIGVRDSDHGAEVAGEIGARALHMNVGEPAGLQAALGQYRPDVLVNNAGVLWDHNIFEDKERTRQSYDVMLHGPFELMRLCRPAMREAGYGRIVNVSSNWGSFAQGLGGGGAYGAAKAALNALTVTAVRDLPACIKVNAMDPGWVQTRMGGSGGERTPAQGAETAIWLATLPDDGPTGGFFRDREAIEW